MEKVNDSRVKSNSFIKKNGHKITSLFSDKTKKRPLLFNVICFTIFISITIFLAVNTVNRVTPMPVSYNQKGNIDYKVYLNKNDFYSEAFLGMNRSYIASLIKYIDVNYNYQFNIEKESNIDFDYQIVADLVIENSGGTSKYFEKRYELTETVTKKLLQNKSLKINENIKLDYNYYNQLANSFKSTFGLETYSYLNVYLDVFYKTSDNSMYQVGDSSKLLIKIPLSEKAIEINLSTTDQDVVKRIVPNEVVIFNIIFLILEFVFFIPACVFFVRILIWFLDKLPKVTPYDRFVNKILRNYDRLIVETDSKLTKSKYHIINLDKFEELLDAHDNLNLPILYTNLVKHKSGEFYIVNNEDLYLFEVSSKNAK